MLQLRKMPRRCGHRNALKTQAHLGDDDVDLSGTGDSNFATTPQHDRFSLLAHPSFGGIDISLLGFVVSTATETTKKRLWYQDGEALEVLEQPAKGILWDKRLDFGVGRRR